MYPVLHATPWDPGLAAKRDSPERLQKEGQSVISEDSGGCDFTERWRGWEGRGEQA